MRPDLCQSARLFHVSGPIARGSREAEWARSEWQGRGAVSARPRLVNVTKTSLRWEKIGDPDSPAPTTEPGMQALFKEIRITVSQEAQIVKAVFPDPNSVMKVFIQRVFAQVIQQQLETLINRATSISTLALLRILNLTHSLCSSLVEDLKTYDVQLNDPTAGSGGQVSGSLVVMLDQALEEMFVPWLEGTRYLDTESKNLVELYAGLLSRFARYHVRIHLLQNRELIIVSGNRRESQAKLTSRQGSAAAFVQRAQGKRLFDSISRCRRHIEICKRLYELRQCVRSSSGQNAFSRSEHLGKSWNDCGFQGCHPTSTGDQHWHVVSWDSIRCDDSSQRKTDSIASEQHTRRPGH